MATVNNVIKDPVCGMHVEPHPETPTIIRKGRRYYFCEDACRRAFEKNPDKFLVTIESHSEEAGPITKTVSADPVCNMRLLRMREDMACNYQGTRYYFCGRKCMRAFVENPDKYIKKMGVVRRFLDRLARANEREFGGGGPSCH